jgi:hypothetical protein
MIENFQELKPLFNQWLKEALAGGVDAPARLTGGLYLGAADQLINGADFYTDASIRKSNALAARIYHDASQSIAHNTVTQLSFNTLQHDSDGMTTSPNQLTIRSEGMYLVGAAVIFANTASPRYRHLWIRHNGQAGNVYIAGDSNTEASPANNVYLAASTVYPSYRSDVITVEVYQYDSTGATANNCINLIAVAPVLFAARIA